MLADKENLLISAPGKVILFGEHSVVHGKTAIAAALGLRNYLFLQKRQDDVIEISFPDIGLDRTWKLTDLPGPLPYCPDEATHPLDMHKDLKQALTKLIDCDEATELAKEQATLAFLYLYICLVDLKKWPHGLTICTRSMLPVGAGLGSSAAFAVCLAAALLLHFGHIGNHSPYGDKSFEGFTDVELDLINRWSYQAEQVIHGNPSGVDNAVSAYGGAKMYTKPSGFQTLQGFTSLRFLLTNTKVPRSTKALVGGVGARLTTYPEVMKPILDAMQGVSNKCVDMFQQLRNGELTTSQVTEQLQDLIDFNQNLLTAIGVSHPSLDTICRITRKFNLKTKLTGAGGGGCAVTLLRDDTTEETVDAIISELAALGYDCFEMSIGGPGAGVASLADPRNEPLRINSISEMQMVSKDELESVAGWKYHRPDGNHV
ncbi:hypothetical protein BZG36_04860 [Bifiguratus adelaidae]|uniref:Mevalonate kinase n=1 Tax=Bifiguratus adelaidae TaxID=1938954 RepID=A0A261XVP1_9FUNG|nr:hypothetical protein BZG36_04860 [Bifiguratus adelaidae]